MEKNRDFRWTVHAFNSAGTGTTGIAADISATYRADNATSGTATSDAAPDEVGNGYYDFLCKGSAEGAVTNYISLFPVTTAATHIIASPKTFQIMPENFNYTGISSGGAVTNVITVDTTTTNTDMVSEPQTSSQTQTIMAGELLTYGTAKSTDVTAGTGIVQTDIAALSFATTDQAANILADTNELQTNQGNWVTATGFSTPAQVSAGTAITSAEIAALSFATTGQAGTIETKIDSMQGNVTDILTDTGTTLDVKLENLLEALVYKQIITEATGIIEVFNSADVSQGSTATGIVTDGTFTYRPKVVV